LTREAILHALARERIEMDDLVGRLGSNSTPICEHPEFRGCFIPGSEDERRIAKLRRDNVDGIARGRRRHMLRQAAVGVLGMALASVIYLGLSTRLFVLPQHILEGLEQGWQALSSAVEEPKPAARPAETLPHDEWLVGAAAAAGPTERHWTVRLQEARALLWAGDARSIDQSRQAFLQVLHHSPSEPEANGGLAEAMAAAQGRDPHWLELASRAVARVSAVAEGTVVAKRARAALALAEGNDALALQVTAACAAEDLGCRLLHAEARSDLKGLIAMGEQNSDSARVQLAIGRVALAGGAWARLTQTARDITARWPWEGEAWAMRAEAFAAIGRWKMAQDAAERSIALDPWRLKTRHLSAAIQLRANGDGSTALAAYGALLGADQIDTYPEAVTARVQGGIAALQAGDLVLARTWADAALSQEDDHPGAKLLSAAIFQQQGEHIRAKAVLRDMDHNLLHGPAGARMHYWAGALFLDMGQQRLARNELEAAANADPHWGDPKLELAWAKLDSNDPMGAAVAIRDLGWMAPAFQRGVDFRGVVDLGPAHRRKWRQRLEEALSADVRLALKREGTLAVLDWYTGRSRGGAGIQAAIDAGDTDLHLQAALAQALLGAEDWAGSLVVTDRVLGSRRRAGLFHGVRAVATHRLGRRAESAGSFDLALKYSGDNPTVLWWAIEARQDAGDTDGVRALLKAMKEQGIDPPSVARLELALADRGE